MVALWRNEVFLCLSIIQCRVKCPEVGRVWSVPAGEGKQIFLEAVGNTVSFLSVYKIIVKLEEIHQLLCLADQFRYLRNNKQ